MKTNLSKLVEATRETLIEGLTLLESVDNRSYSQRPMTIETDSAGNHVRHCLEFFHCFLAGVSGRAVDYAARERHRDIACDRLLGMLRIAEVIQQLRALEELDPDDSILVRAEDDEAGCWTPSTLGRELEFLRSHTVHHYALIAIILRSHSRAVPAQFGVAPSTLRFRAAETVCAQ